MRAAFGEERRELHSTHSIQGKLAVFLVIAFGYGWSVLAFDLSGQQLWQTAEVDGDTHVLKTHQNPSGHILETIMR